jgi:signal transduction histidine kinase
VTHQLSIFQKGLILVAIPLLSQGVFLGTLVKIRLDQADAQAWALHATRVLAEADALSALFAETHSALRGYLLTEDPRLSRQYQAFREQMEEKIQVLADLVADNKDQVARVRTIEAKARRLSDSFDKQHELNKTGRHDLAVQETQGFRGEFIAEVREAIREFLHAEERLTHQRQAVLSEQAVRQDWVLYGGGALAVVSTALLGVVFARGIAGRLTVLAENAGRFAEGEELLAPLHGSDELARLDRAFRTMAAALKQKNEENELFVYSVSHDLRSPLVNLQGFSRELAASCTDLRALVLEADLPEANRRRALTLIDCNMADSVHFIQTAVSRLSGIIDALLRLSRAGRVDYRRQAVDVSAAVRRVVEALWGTITARGAEITVGPLPTVWGDPTAVEQLFANLIGNAVNYLDPARPGRVEVGVRDEPADGQPVPAFHTLFVRDNGLGIPEAHQANAFVAFQRLHPDVAPGEGIGLALVHRIVERHGGRIWVESAPGVGTTFFVSLPAEAEATRSPGPVPSPF